MGRPKKSQKTNKIEEDLILEHKCKLIKKWIVYPEDLKINSLIEVEDKIWKITEKEKWVHRRSQESWAYTLEFENKRN